MQIYEKHAVTIARICNKHLGEKFPIESVSSIPLYTYKNPNAFQEFLINKRIRRFLALKILHHVGLHGEFIIGHGAARYYPLYDDTPDPVHELGPTIVPELFSGEEVFNHLLREMNIASLIIQNEARVDGQTRQGMSGSVRYEKFTETEELADEVIVMLRPIPLIITQSRLYYDPSKPKNIAKVLNILLFHKEFFDAFLQAHKDKNVDHDLYVKWLMAWFPGMIHVRSLT